MKETLKLRHPIDIDGKKVKALTYDSEEITAALFAEADTLKKKAAGISNMSISPAIEFDFGLHLYIGFAAIIAVNPEYDFTDLERIKGSDIRDVMNVGRRFFIASAEDGQPNSSANASETTAEPTTPESEN